MDPQIFNGLGTLFGEAAPPSPEEQKSEIMRALAGEVQKLQGAAQGGGAPMGWAPWTQAQGGQYATYGAPESPDVAAGRLADYSRSRGEYGPSPNRPAGSQIMTNYQNPGQLSPEETAAIDAGEQLRALINARSALPMGAQGAAQFDKMIAEKAQAYAAARQAQAAIEAPTPREQFAAEQATTQQTLGGGAGGGAGRMYTEPVLGKGKFGGVAVTGGKQTLKPGVAEAEKASLAERLAQEKQTREDALPFVQHPAGGKKGLVLLDKETGQNISRETPWNAVDSESMVALPMQDIRQLHQLQSLGATYTRSAERIIAAAKQPGANLSHALETYVGGKLGVSQLAADIAQVQSDAIRAAKALTGTARFSEKITNMESNAMAIGAKDTLGTALRKYNNFMSQLQDITDLILEKPVGQPAGTAAAPAEAGAAQPGKARILRRIR